MYLAKKIKRLNKFDKIKIIFPMLHSDNNLPEYLIITFKMKLTETSIRVNSCVRLCLMLKVMAVITRLPEK